ncbi:MAG: Protein YciF [Fimbriimonadaceae bacterium]|nr:Protein YciF [Fimbriimonadaceae bacterium]
MNQKDGLHELYIHTLQDSYSAEKQITNALPKVIDAVNDGQLKQALSSHLQETIGHAAQVKAMIETYGEDADGEMCDGMKGLLEEGESIIKDFDNGPVRDAALISACQKVEHYEMAAYGTLRVFASHLGYQEDINRLSDILGQEYNADDTLTQIAEGSVNWKAEGAQMPNMAGN